MTKTNKTRAKSNMVEMRARVATVYRLLLSGMRRREIIQYVREKTDWGVTDRAVDNYIKHATAEIAEVTEEEKKTALGMAYKRLDTLYYKSLLVNDYKTALAVQKEISDLNGLHTIQHEISGSVGVTIIDDIGRDEDE